MRRDFSSRVAGYRQVGGESPLDVSLAVGSANIAEW